MKTKYDWSNVSEEVKGIATDADGVAIGYINKPTLDKGFDFWVDDSDDFMYPTIENFDIFNERNWQDSLEERPHG